jgi:hypothetical protein
MRLMLVVLAACALLAAACGEDDGGGSAGGGGNGGDSASGGGAGGNGSGGGGAEGSGGGSEQDAVRQAMVDYANAIAEGDAGAACDSLAEKAQQQFTRLYKGDCEESFEMFFQQLPESEVEKARNLDASKIKVELEGDTATVTGPTFDRPAPMVKTDGDWKIASFVSGGG